MSEQSRPPVVVGVDGSADGLRAAAYAMREAQVSKTDLKIVHAVDDAVLAGAWGVVYDPSVLEEAGQHAVDEARHSVIELGFPPERVHGDVQLGNPASVLVRESHDAHMVVVGRRSVSGLERIFVGSTGVAVAANAECPVVMISHDTNPVPTGDKSTVAVGLDASDKCHSAIKWAVREAHTRGAALVVVYAIQPPPAGLFGSRAVTDEQRDELLAAARVFAESTFTKAAEGLMESEPRYIVELGNPIDHLVAASAHADLLVVGARRSVFPGFSLGGVIRGVMAHGKCPIGITRA